MASRGPKENGPHINRFKNDPSLLSAHDFACRSLGVTLVAGSAFAQAPLLDYAWRQSDRAGPEPERKAEPVERRHPPERGGSRHREDGAQGPRSERGAAATFFRRRSRAAAKLSAPSFATSTRPRARPESSDTTTFDHTGRRVARSIFSLQVLNPLGQRLRAPAKRRIHRRFKSVQRLVAGHDA